MDAKEFPREEYENRWQAVQRAMRGKTLDAIMVTSAANYRYFTGHRTSFWSIRDRLRMCVIPQKGEPVVLLTPLEDEWCRACSYIDKRLHHSWEGFATWSERGRGIEELAKNLKAIGLSGKRIGMELGIDQRLGMTYRDTEYLLQQFPAEFVDASELLWELRLRKSPREVEMLRKSTQILDEAFDDTWRRVAEDTTEKDLAATMVESMERQRSDAMSFIFVQSDVGEREIPFRDPTYRRLCRGDLVYIDTGSIYRGYKSDYCRMIAVGTATDSQRLGYERIHRVMQASIEAIKPGGTVGDIVVATDQAIEREGFATSKLPVRYGHSIGLEMPEPPSIASPIASVKIEPGMVLCVEPGALVDGRYFQLEEMVVVTDDGYDLLSRPAPPELQVAR